MAYYNDFNLVNFSDSNLFEKRWRPGSTVQQSGIYRCTSCGGEAACNEGDPFPTQNEHQHNTYEPIIWKLVVATNSLEDD